MIYTVTATIIAGEDRVKGFHSFQAALVFAKSIIQSDYMGQSYKTIVIHNEDGVICKYWSFMHSWQKVG